MAGLNKNIFDEKEFHEISRKLGAKPYIREITIEYNTGSYFYKIKDNVEKDRRGEVVFCVIRPDGKVIVVTCTEYPRGIFRIPTGGIKHNENILCSVFREASEELGLKTEIVSFPGVLKLRFIYHNDTVMFYSYLFILKETGGRLLVDATDDEISEVREVDIGGLESVVSALEKIEGAWGDWGRFRYETSNAILQYLKTLGNCV